MAEIAIIATFFAGINVVMKAVSLYQQHRAKRANPPRQRLDDRQKTGKRGGERTAHPQGIPKRPDDTHRARPHQQAPKNTNGSSRVRSFSQVVGPSQQLVVRNSTPQLAHNASVEDRRLRNSFGGIILLTPEQQARDTHRNTSKYGVSTGARPSKSSASVAMKTATDHWLSLKSSDNGVNTANARVVAVVNFTKSNVTMFVEKHETYYRSYKVKSCPDIAGFVLKYQRREVCSGEIVEGKLARCNHGITHVEDDGECAFKSSNCWRKLGISAAGIEREVARDPIFVQMVRGAVFGLISCVYKKPSSMNVDMRRGNGVDFVHVDTDVGGKLERGSDCCFSVFSIGSTNGWVRERVLVG